MVALRVFGSSPQPHQLDAARFEQAAVAEAVGVLEVGEISPDQTSRLSAAWMEAAGELPTPLWTSAGRDMLERFAPGASTAAIVIDAQQRLVAVIPLDGRAVDASPVEADVTAALTKAWAGSR